MAITSYDNIVAGLSSGSITEQFMFFKGAYGEGFVPMAMEDSPGATDLTGILCNASTPGLAPEIIIPGTGDSLILAASAEAFSGAGSPAILLCDLLWRARIAKIADPWYSSKAFDFTPPALTRYGNGDGVHPLIVVQGQASGMLNATLNIVCTDNLGRTGQTMPISTKDWFNNIPGTVSAWQKHWLLPVPSGASGVRSIQRLNYSSSATVLNDCSIMVALIRPLMFVYPSASGRVRPTFSQMASTMIRLPRGTDDSQPCLFGMTNGSLQQAYIGLTLAAA